MATSGLAGPVSHAGGDPLYHEGFVWVPREPAVRFTRGSDGRTAHIEQHAPLNAADELLLAASPGDRVPAPACPPWIVAAHGLGAMTMIRWPGRLLRVRTVPPATEPERDAVAAANQALHASRHYTRAAVVDVLADIPAHVLFGPRGQQVATVIETAMGLTPGQAAKLAAARHPDAPLAYQRAWDRWAGRPAASCPPEPGPHVLLDSRNRSPVGGALLVIDDHVDLQAARHGAAAWAQDPDDRLEHHLTLLPPWGQAANALLEAVIAVGDPESAGEDRNVLTAAWRSLEPGPASGT
jgi:hypothetical protein